MSGLGRPWLERWPSSPPHYACLPPPGQPGYGCSHGLTDITTSKAKCERARGGGHARDLEGSAFPTLASITEAPDSHGAERRIGIRLYVWGSAWIQGCQSLESLLQAACRVGFSGDVTSGSLVLLKRTGLELEYLGMALGSSVGSLYVSGGSDFPSLASSHHW